MAAAREVLAEGYREAAASARDAGPPAVVRADAAGYGHFPAGWPPEA